MTDLDPARDEREATPASELSTAELEQRRNELAASLAELDRERAASVQANSYARARERSGVTGENADEAGRLAADEDRAHAAMRVARVELHRLEAELEARPRAGGFGAALRRLRRGVR